MNTIRSYLHVKLIGIIFISFHLIACGQKPLAGASLTVKYATKQLFSGGAAGNANSIQYLIACKILKPGNISNVKAMIDRLELPVTLIYRNTELPKASLSKGDSLFFRITQRSGAHNSSAYDLENQGVSNPSTPTVIVHYEINNKREQIVLTKFLEKDSPLLQ